MSRTTSVTLSIAGIGLFTFFVFACGGPSQTQIEGAVRTSLELGVPVDMQRNLMGGVEPTIEAMKIMKQGKAQGEGSSRYYPVRVWAKGTCYTIFGKGYAFDGEADYHVRQDEYGKWIAASTSPGPRGEKVPPYVPKR